MLFVFIVIGFRHLFLYCLLVTLLFSKSVLSHLIRMNNIRGYERTINIFYLHETRSSPMSIALLFYLFLCSTKFRTP